MTESFILFDNECYRQHDGVAMGSPLGPLSLISFYMYPKFFDLKNARLNLDQQFIRGMLMILFCFFIISIKFKNSNITLTPKMPILSLPLKLRLIIRYLFLTSKLLEKTKNSLPQFIASLHSVVCLLTLRVLYLTRTNTP